MGTPRPLLSVGVREYDVAANHPSRAVIEPVLARVNESSLPSTYTICTMLPWRGRGPERWHRSRLRRYAHAAVLSQLPA